MVLQVFYRLEARFSRTQHRGARARKRLDRFKAITFSSKLEPRYLDRMSTTSQYVPSSTSTVSLSSQIANRLVDLFEIRFGTLSNGIGVAA